MIKHKTQKPHRTIAGEYIVKYKEFMMQKENISEPTSNGHLAWMLWQIRDFIDDDEKANRWLGFVQGVMASKNMLDIQSEAEPIFKNKMKENE